MNTSVSAKGAAGIKAKHQRLVLVLIALVALIGAALLAIWGLRSQASYFYVPSDIVAARPDPDRGVRLGGMVEKGSLKTEPDGVTIAFVALLPKASLPRTAPSSPTTSSPSTTRSTCRAR